ncbi:MAG: hypothetical protein AB7I19_11570, partial [Planctomycetota bacterium]
MLTSCVCLSSLRIGRLALALLVSLLAAAAPRAQLVPRELGKKSSVVDRPAGAWRGTATETIGDGQPLSYAIDLNFRGSDDALQLEVTATAKVPAGEQTLTVRIRALYRGRFAERKLRMNSESVDVQVVETGEKIPSAPQQVEATLENGKLTGRVGSEGDGWTTFTATPRDGAIPAPIPAPAGVALRGKFVGTSREPGPDGNELVYPISIVFRGEGSNAGAEVSADLQYPLQNGGKTPVEYRATFAGNSEGGRFQMRSTRIQIRLPALGRDEQGPAQQFEGRLENGVLTATIGDGGPNVSRIEARPQGGTVDEVVTTDEGPDPSPSPDPSPRPLPRPTGRSAYSTLILGTHSIEDPGMGGIVSHTMLVPKDWQFRGGAQWNANPDQLVNFAGELSGPSGESLTFFPTQNFTYTRVQSQLGVNDDTRGQTNADGSIAMHAPQGPGEVAVKYFIPRYRQGATGVEVVTAERLPDLEAATRELQKTTFEFLEQLAAQSRQSSRPDMQVDSQVWFVVERVRVRYRENGVAFEEELQYSLTGNRSMFANELMRTDNGFWIVSEARSARAKAGELDDRLGALWVCADSLRPTPRWSAIVADTRLEIMKARTASMRANLAEIIRRGQDAARTRSEISDMNMAAWRSQQDSMDRVHRARIDAIGERQDFRSADGDT